MKARIDIDESLTYYLMPRTNPYKCCGKEIEVTAETLTRWREIQAKFYAMQDEIEAVLEKPKEG